MAKGDFYLIFVVRKKGGFKLLNKKIDIERNF